MTELFPPSLAAQILEVERELRLRQQVYPRMVSQGRMKLDDSERHIRTMQAVLNTLKGLK